jgi:hypothetical protein
MSIREIKYQRARKKFGNAKGIIRSRNSTNGRQQMTKRTKKTKTAIGRYNAKQKKLNAF